jgi:raffinose/stachyose/melibiose transport system substrate-binding protein
MKTAESPAARKAGAFSTNPHNSRARKVGVLLAGVTVIALALAGCSSTPAAPAKQSLTVQFEGSATNAAMFTVLKKGFEKENPGVTVNLQSVPSAAKNGSNLAVITSSAAPDVAVVPGNSPAYQALLKKNGLTDLAPLWKSANLDKRFAPSTNALTVYKGKHYSVALQGVFYDVVYYNADLFKKAGIAVPADHRISSASQLYSIAAALRKIGVAPLELAGKSGYQASWMIDASLPTSANASELQNYLSSWSPSVAVTAKYTDPAFVNVLSRLQAYQAHNVYQDGFLGADQPTTQAAFLQGQSGMVLDGTWDAATNRKQLKATIGWLLLPPVNSSKKTEVTGSFAPGWAVPVNAKHKALAMKFLAYALTPKAQVAATIDVGSQIASVNDVPSSAYKNADPMIRQMLDDVAANGIQEGWTGVVPAGVGQALTDPLVQELYAGKLTPSAVASQIQAALPTVRTQ